MLTKSDPSKKKGTVGITRAIHEFTQQGYTVLMPLIDANKYDFVVEREGEFKRVQVKTTCWQANYGDARYNVILETRGSSRTKYTTSRFDKSDYDILFVLAEDGRCWVIPSEVITSTTALTVGTAKYEEYRV